MNVKNTSLNLLDSVEIYKLILNGKIKKFPNGFWTNHDKLQNAAKVTRYLIEELLNWDDECVKNNLKLTVFKNNKLTGMMNLCFTDSTYEAINNAYPNKFHPWEFSQTSDGFWLVDENIIKALDWLTKEKYNMDHNMIKSHFTVKFLIANNLSGIVNRFNSNTFDIINFYIPGIFKPWEITRVKKGFWDNPDNVNWALDWLFTNKLKWSDNEIIKHFNASVIIENNLLGLLKYKFNGSPFQLLNYFYPNKFKAFHLSNTPNSYWKSNSNIEDALHWLVKEKLNISYETFFNMDIKKIMIENGLGGLLINVFKNSKVRVIQFINLHLNNSFE